MRGSMYSTSLVISMVFGGICGGPIGMLVAKALHSGLAIHIGLEATGVVGGALVGRRTYQRCRRSQPKWEGSESELLITKRVRFQLPPDYMEIDKEGLESDDSEETETGFQRLVDIMETETEFQRLVEIMETNKELSKLYKILILDYHQSVAEGINPLEASSDTLFDFNRLLLITYQPLETIRAVNFSIYAERILMMSIYQSIWKYCCRETTKNNELYSKYKATKIEYTGIPNSILELINQLPSRVTASLKIANLIQAYHLLDTYATSQLEMSEVSCDVLIPLFTSALALSDLDKPFAELLFMEHFLPNHLLGLESYVFSTWKATCYFITGRMLG